VREILCSGSLDAASKRALFEKRLAVPPTQQAELIGALLERLDLDPAGGVSFLAKCIVTAKEALRGQLQNGSRLATALVGAGAKANSVADTAAVVFGRQGGAFVGTGTSVDLWEGLARLHGSATWEYLPPSPARAAAIRLWSRLPELAPPQVTSAPLARWLVQAEAPEAEKPILLKALQSAWVEQQAGVAMQAEDAFAALLQDMPGLASKDERRPSVEWLVAVAVPSSRSGRHSGASLWACPLLASAAEAAAAAAVEFLGAPRGRAALTFAWITLYTAVLGALHGDVNFGDINSEATVCAILRLLERICGLLSSKGCWRELATALLCIVVRWPDSGRTNKAFLAAWVDFARHVLLDLPDSRPEAPLATVIPILLAAVPAPSEPSETTSSSSASSLEELTKDLRARASGLTGALVGLTNLGNTCYLNSLLQAMALTVGLTADLFTLFPPQLPAASGACDAERVDHALLPATGAAVRATLAQALTRLFLARRPVSPTAFAAGSCFGLSGQQQDVTELARWLFERLGEPDKEGSLLERSFGGRTRVSIRCGSCQHLQERPEAFSDLCLSMAVPGSSAAATVTGDGIASVSSTAAVAVPPQCSTTSTTDLLHAYLEEETLAGYRCDSCGAMGSSLRRCEITRPPQQLVVTLNRFAYTKQGGQEKVDTHVAVDVSLRLPFKPTSDSAEGMEQTAASYVLYAIVTHAGSTPHSGHYVCLGRSSEVGAGDASEGVWRRFDDSTVSALPGTTTQEALDQLANGAATAYMLFYRRCDGGARPAAPRRLPSRFFAESVLAELPDDTEGFGGSNTSSVVAPPPPPLGGTGGSPDMQSPPGGPLGGVGGWVC